MSNHDRVIYINAVIVGFVIMAFEMVGSRYLNPFFGSSIYTWAALITVVMIALTVGYFVGGVLADKYPTPLLLGIFVFTGSVWLGLIPLFNNVALDWVFSAVDDIRYASLVGAFIILLLPLTLLGIYSPYAIRLILCEKENSGTVSGRIYGISTIGSVLGTLVTTFYLIPIMGTKMITYSLSAIGALSGLSLMVLGIKNSGIGLMRTAKVHNWFFGGLILILALSTQEVMANALSIEQIKALPNGLVEHVESEYNDIFISRETANTPKKMERIRMSFRRRGKGYTESLRDLDNEYALPVKYTKFMTIGLAYNPQPKHMVMLGLGGGTTTKYLQKYLPDTEIKVVELDNEVINMAKKYFGVKASEKYQLFSGDARVYLRKNKQAYDIIMIDAFRGGYIPFHLLTNEFYQLVKQRMEKDSVLVINLNGNSKLFESSINTLRSVFSRVDTFTAKGMVNVIIVAHNQDLDATAVALNAQKLQQEKQFYYDINELLKAKTELEVNPKAPIFTDDFAPANVYDSIKTHNSPQW